MAAIRARFADVQAEMTKGSGGVFDVAVDGQRIFSKHEAHRFPTQDEILAGIERIKKA